MTFAFVTPSYGPDFERCQLMCESVDRFTDADVRHYLVVPRRDERLFRPLASDRRIVRTVESVLPWWIRRVPVSRRWWASVYTKPIRGWVLQQVVKLSAGSFVDGADALLFLDSDTLFVRPLATARLATPAGAVRLARVPFNRGSVPEWVRNAKWTLGLAPDRDVPLVNYEGNFITWRLDVLAKLTAHLRQAHGGRHWIRSFTRPWNVSEYMTYGVFAEHVLGLDAAGHYADDSPFVHQAWGDGLSTTADFQQCLDKLLPAHVAVMVYSKGNVPVSRYRDAVRRWWDEHSAR